MIVYHFLYAWSIFWASWYIFQTTSNSSIPWKKLLLVSIASSVLIYFGSLTGIVTDIFHLLIIEWIFLKHLSIKQQLFYTIYTTLSLDFLLRLLYSLTFHSDPNFYYLLRQPDWDLIMINFLVIPTYWCIRKIFNLDFQAITDQRDEKINIFFTRITVILTSYYVFIHIIYFLRFFNNPIIHWLNRYHDLVIFPGIIGLAWLLYGISRWARERLQRDLEFDRQQHINNLESYNHRVEALYKELSVFKRDYQQSMSKLAKSIASQDMDNIRQTYEQIVGENHYASLSQSDIGKLATIHISPIKSMLSSKILQAQEAGIEVNVEAPDEINQVPMKIIDLVTIIGILSDNAIEAAKESSEKMINIAYFLVDNQQFFVIENSTKEAQVSISHIFENGYSSKGGERGIGLANVEQIISEYDTVNLSTRSEDYLFRQTLAMTITTKTLL